MLNIASTALLLTNDLLSFAKVCVFMPRTQTLPLTYLTSAPADHISFVSFGISSVFLDNDLPHKKLTHSRYTHTHTCDTDIRISLDTSPQRGRHTA